MATLESKKAATLGKRSIIGMILGLALGAILCFVPNGYVRDDIIINTILNIVGNGYLNLIKMTIIPFVFASLVMGISSATDVKQVGRIGGNPDHLCSYHSGRFRLWYFGRHDPQARCRRGSRVF